MVHPAICIWDLMESCHCTSLTIGSLLVTGQWLRFFSVPSVNALYDVLLMALIDIPDTHIIHLLLFLIFACHQYCTSARHFPGEIVEKGTRMYRMYDYKFAKPRKLISTRTSRMGIQTIWTLTDELQMRYGRTTDTASLRLPGKIKHV